MVNREREDFETRTEFDHRTIFDKESISRFFHNWLELRRQGFHLGYGLIVLFLLSNSNKNVIMFSLFGLSLFGLVLSAICKRKNIPIIRRILEFFDRKDDLDVFPGKGAITLTTGFFLSLFLFTPQIAQACIAILTVGDSFSTIIGKHLGNLPIIKGLGKTVEGSMAGILTGAFMALLYIPFIPAILASIFGMSAEYLETRFLDDNILIPLVAGIFLTIFL